jgi:hypothetical protein
MFFTPNLVIGLTIMAAGAVLLLDTLGIRPAESLIKYWPGLIVLFGASLVAQAFRPVDPAVPRKPETGVPCFFLFLLAVAMFGYFGFPGGSAEARGGRQVSATAIMGNAERDGVGADIRSGRVAAVMGRSSLDLRQVQLGPGEEIVVDVFVTMGRATVRIPDHWVVDASALPVMGSVDEERFTPLPDVPAPDAPKTSDREAGDGLPSLPELPALPGDAPRRVEPPAPPKSGPQPRLKLRGFVLMGKVEVSS